MRQHRTFRILSSLLVLLLVVTSFGSAEVAPQLAQIHAAETASFQQLAATGESEPNDALLPTVQANDIGPTIAERQALGGKLDWSRVVTGTISAADDRDVYKFNVPPASTIRITMDDPPADYDLVLATAGDLELAGDDDGLEGVLELGGSIAALGGSIAALGGSIAALGGSIAALGGSIAALGGSIAALSVQPGTAGEEIETFVWQPGTYFLAVIGSNGAGSDQPYTLNFAISEGALSKPEPAPRVRVELNDVADAATIRTLYIVAEQRMKNYYDQPAESDVDEVILSLLNLASDEGDAFVINLDNYAGSNGGPELATLYAEWDNNADNPFYANRLAQTIDNIINAATVRNPLPSQATGILSAGVTFTPTSSTDPPLPNIEHIVLVGADPVIPFLRVPDLTAVANEADYAEYMRQEFGSDVIDPNTPLGAALQYRTLLTDNLYGADRSYRFGSFPLFIPNRAVGRLVETPADIATYLRTYDSSYSAFTSPLEIPATGEDWAFTAGYDFVTDQSEVVADRLNSYMGGDPGNSIRLINDTWTAADLREEWFEGQFTDFYTSTYSVEARSFLSLQSLNGHFDHWQIIPADGGDNGTLLAQSVYTPTGSLFTDSNELFFTNRLAYSIGCHSGYSVPDPLVPLRDGFEFVNADFPQAYLKQGGNWIGNTGYGYGSLDSIDYSERLALLFTEELGRDVPDPNTANYAGQSIGQALVHAKQRYVRNATTLSIYDAKVLQVMNLYGLPQIRVLVDDPIQPPPEERFTSSDRIAPLPPAGGSLTRLITFTIDYNSASIDRTGSSRLAINAVDVDDSFIGDAIENQFVRPFRANQLGEPELPQFAYDLSIVSGQVTGEQLNVRSVKLLGGTYDEIVNFDPQFTQVLTETFAPLVNQDVEPSFEGGAGRWYPDKFFNFTSVVEGDTTYEQLVVKTAQFQADTGGRTGVLRPYSQLVFEVRYLDPLAGNVEAVVLADEEPPYIESVEFTRVDDSSLQSDRIRVDVTVSDGIFDGDTNVSGTASVEATYTIPGTGGTRQWQQVALTPPAETSGSWTALIPFGNGKVDVIISATDRAGNTSFFTAKGSLDPADIQEPGDAKLIWLPLISRP
jgi:hypothetical protein